MIASSIRTGNRHDFHSEAFQLAMAFLERSDLGTLAPGAYPLEMGVTAHVQHYATSPAEQLRFETHERYHDIQYVIDGEEWIGLIAREGLEPDGPHDEGKDIRFYREPAASGRMLLRAGDYVVVEPEMAHKPRCSVTADMQVRKVVLKVPVL